MTHESLGIGLLTAMTILGARVHSSGQSHRIGREKAIVAIARKLLVIIWHVLTAKVADRQAKSQQVARYFIAWGRQLRVKTTMGIKTSEFARQHLDRLKLGWNLERGPYGSVTYCLPPATTTT